MQRFIIAAVLISGILLAANSCKDVGSEPPKTQAPPPQPVILTDSLILIPGTTATAHIAGGTSPYVIVSQSDTNVAVASIAGDSLKVLARALGSSDIIIEDSSSPRLSDTITVSVTAPVSFSSQVQPIFTNNCVNAGCHPGSGAPFSLLASVSYINLVGITATTGSCAGGVRVEPGNTEASVLLKRLEGASCGSQMPFGLTPLSSADIQLIRDWIGHGASNN